MVNKRPVPPLNTFVFPPELIAFMATRAGVRRAFKVGALLVEWGMCVDKLGREPSAEDFQAWAKESRATWYRRMSDFRRVWPEDSTPHRVWLWLQEQQAPADAPAPDPAVTPWRPPL